MLLIQYKTGFNLAKDLCLVPEHLSWDDWLNIVEQSRPLMLSNSRSRSPRFIYGELRLSRVDMLYRLLPPYRPQDLFRGYLFGNVNYKSFIRRNFAWLLIVFVYLTIILTAMQLGLGTHELKHNKAFHRTSYGFTVFAIVLPLATLVFALIVSLITVAYNVSTTFIHVRRDASDLAGSRNRVGKSPV